MSWPAQQEPERLTPSPWSESCKVTPMTSPPVPAARAATTELATPPDMATTILALEALRPRSKLMDICPASLPEVHSSRLDGSQAVKSRGKILARHERQFEAESEVGIGFANLLGGDDSSLSDRERQDAIICYLTRGEGWQDALKLL